MTAINLVHKVATAPLENGEQSVKGLNSVQFTVVPEVRKNSDLEISQDTKPVVVRPDRPNSRRRQLRVVPSASSAPVVQVEAGGSELFLGTGLVRRPAMARKVINNASQVNSKGRNVSVARVGESVVIDSFLAVLKFILGFIVLMTLMVAGMQMVVALQGTPEAAEVVEVVSSQVLTFMG